MTTVPPATARRPDRREARAVRRRRVRRRGRGPPRRRHRPPGAARRPSPTPTPCSSARPPRSTPRCFAAATQLKVVARAGVGLDNVDVPAATARGVLVVNAPTSNIVSAAEHAVALLLAAARRIPGRRREPARRASGSAASFSGVEIPGKTVGVVGLGKIGQLFAQPHRGVRHRAHRLRPVPAAGPRRAARHRAGRASTSCWRRADIISIHLPKTPETQGPHRRRGARQDQAGRASSSTPRAAGCRRGGAGRRRALRARRRRRHRRLRHRADHRRARCSSCPASW